ncbi:MAG: DUF4386 family protein [Rubrobacter sp.]|nr:DUF4386 family protein [Rubrobacter sp.]
MSLMVAFVAGVLPADQGGDLPPKYFELAAAIESPAIYRLTIALDIATWVALGGFLVALGAVLSRSAPVRGVLVAACGIGQVSGLIGAFIRLNGTSGTAELYEGASPGRQEAILPSYSYMQSAVFSHFNAGSLLWGVALLLVASVLVSLEGFPRWLAVVVALPGVLRVPVSVAEISTGADRDEMLLAIRAVARGEAVFGPDIAQGLIQYFTFPTPAPSRHSIFPELTDRAQAIVRAREAWLGREGT